MQRFVMSARYPAVESRTHTGAQAQAQAQARTHKRTAHTSHYARAQAHAHTSSVLGASDMALRREGKGWYLRLNSSASIPSPN